MKLNNNDLDVQKSINEEVSVIVTLQGIKATLEEIKGKRKKEPKVIVKVDLEYIEDEERKSESKLQENDILDSYKEMEKKEEDDDEDEEEEENEKENEDDDNDEEEEKEDPKRKKTTTRRSSMV